MGHLQIYACFNFNSLKCAPVPSNKILLLLLLLLLLLYYYYYYYRRRCHDDLEMFLEIF